MQLLADGQVTDADAEAGVGGVFSLVDPAQINQLQHIAVEQSRLHIPILFAYDTIHGYRTIFPVPLGRGQLRSTRTSRRPTPPSAPASPRRSASSRSTARWSTSRTSPAGAGSSEGSGEDPYLGSVFAAARVKGAQGSDYARPDKVVASVKHFVAYGQPEGGRDYNTTDMSEQRLRNLYLPPFKAAIDAGADTVMCSFNAINGVPGLREPLHRDRHPQEGVGLRRLHRERLHRGRGDCGPARRRRRTPAPAGTASPPTVPTPARMR